MHEKASSEVQPYAALLGESDEAYVEVSLPVSEDPAKHSPLDSDLLTACAQKTKQLFLERYPEFHLQFHGACEQ